MYKVSLISAIGMMVCVGVYSAFHFEILEADTNLIKQICYYGMISLAVVFFASLWRMGINEDRLRKGGEDYFK